MVPWPREMIILGGDGKEKKEEAAEWKEDPWILP